MATVDYLGHHYWAKTGDYLMANWGGWLMTARALIGRLTDLLIAGRQRGLWQEGPGYIPPEKELPRRPFVSHRNDKP